MANELEVVHDSDDAEHAHHVVCIKITDPLVYPDNLVSPCCKCGEMVQFRPHAPKTPPRICWECASPDMGKEAIKGKLTIMLTPKSFAEVIEHIACKKAN